MSTRAETIFDLPAASTEQNQAVAFAHYPVLDGLRAIAIVAVMFYHAALFVPELKAYTSGGFLGVDIFFVLSGFLITSVLLKEFDRSGTISLRNFFARRFLRLAPAFWLFLGSIFLFGDILLPADQSTLIYSNNNFLYSFFYLMNYHRALSGPETGNLNHIWSLSIEEQFYLIWSLILFKAFSEEKGRWQIAGEPPFSCWGLSRPERHEPPPAPAWMSCITRPRLASTPCSSAA